MDFVQIIVAGFGLAGVLGGAFIGLSGRKEETKATETATLIQGQAKRIDSLENRQETTEKLLAETREALTKTQDDLAKTKLDLWALKTVAGELRRALAKAVSWIGDAVEWMNGPRDTAPPSPPDSDAWKELIDGVSPHID
ncbi:hypothetical protein H0194_04510 [Corynebacterium incognita]|uniref:Uncharacterized protein n=1 Tax=Corynebacterium incognita TaxID=2754725 RepID=A0A7G7CRN1_9CORY|nr:hypothetical protein [Corynebacterium incognita]QNE90247.1 hypothetical protein H0194_04510 [Corynebacterium incognita]